MKDKLKKMCDFLVEVLIMWVFACSLIVGIVIMRLFPEVGIVALVVAVAIVLLNRISK